MKIETGDIYLTTLSTAPKVTNGNTVLNLAVDIVCTTCYLKGTATAQLTIAGNFNASQEFDSIKSQVKTETDQIGNETITYVDNYVKNVSTSFSLDAFTDFPPMPIDFDINIPAIPQCDLLFTFDGLELYMQIGTIISGGATYTINLYTSETEIGIDVANELLVGVVFTVDLILSVEADIDISSGFHIQLHDGLAINIPMFSQNVSNITL